MPKRTEKPEATGVARKRSAKSSAPKAPSASSAKAKSPRRGISQSRTKAPAVDGDTIVTTKVAADLLGYTPRRLQQLVGEGVIESFGRGRFRLKRLIQDHAGHLRRQIDEAREDDSDDAIKFERARRLRLENDRDERILIEAEEAIAALEDIIGTIRAEMSGLPTRATRDMELRKKLARDVDDIQTRTIARLGKRLAALQTCDAAIEADAADDAG